MKKITITLLSIALVRRLSEKEWLLVKNKTENTIKDK